jgi:hypothetical protein
MVTDPELLTLYDNQTFHENLMLCCRDIDRMDTKLVRST